MARTRSLKVFGALLLVLSILLGEAGCASCTRRNPEQPTEAASDTLPSAESGTQEPGTDRETSAGEPGSEPTTEPATDNTGTETQHTHTWVSQQTEPTCEDMGYTVKACLECQESYITDIVVSKGHSFGEWAVTTEASCTENGCRERTCNVCGTKETEEIPATGHNYVMNDAALFEIGDYGAVRVNDDFEIIENPECRYYTCTLCGKEVTVDSADEMPGEEKSTEQFVNDVSPAQTFTIACDEDEAYIRENLCFMYAQFEGTEYENDPDAQVEYALIDNGNGTWTVTPSQELSGFIQYKLEAGEGISLPEYENDRVLFSVEVPEQEHAVLNPDMLFLYGLEQEDAGYYPFRVEEDENNGCFVLHLSKQGIFTDDYIGRILCLGDCTGKEDVEYILLQDILFGKIEQILPGENGTAVLILSTPELKEIYSELAVSVARPVTVDDFNANEEELSENIINNIIASDDFAKTVAELHLLALTYCEENGLDEAAAQVRNMVDLSKLKIKPEFKCEPKDHDDEHGSAILTVKLTISFPVEIDAHTKLTFSCEMSVSIELDYSVQVGVGNWHPITGRAGDAYDYTKCIVKTTSVTTISFGAEFSYSYDLAEDWYIVNTASHTIHYSDCRTAPTSGTRMTYAELKDKYGEDKLSGMECKLCKPISARNIAPYVLDCRTNTLHTKSCDDAPKEDVVCKYLGELPSKGSCKYCTKCNPAKAYIIGKDNKVHTAACTQAPKNGTSADTLPIGKTYAYCQTCHPEQSMNQSFNKKLDYAEWGDLISMVKVKTPALAKYKTQDDDMNWQSFAPIPFLCFEFGIKLGYEFSVDVKATINATFTTTTTSQYGFVVEKGKPREIEPCPSTSRKTAAIDLQGSMTVKAGVGIMLNISFIGCSKFAYVGVSFKIGLYAEINGVAHAEIESYTNVKEQYWALYLSTGIYYSLNFAYRFFKDPKEVPLLEKEIPLWSVGYAKAYYGWTDYNKQVNVTAKSRTPVSNLLPEVKFFNLQDMSTGTETLSNLSNSQYSVGYSFYNPDGTENTDFAVKGNASHSFGIATLEVSDNVSKATDVVMKVTVTWKKPATAISSFLSTSFNTTNAAYYLPELEVKIHYNPVNDTYSEPDFSSLFDDSGTRTWRIDEHGNIVEDKPEPTPSVGLKYKSNGDGTCSVTGIGTCKDKDVVIPSVSPNGERVTSIGNYYEKQSDIIIGGSWSNMTSIRIPASVTSIDDYAFWACKKLTSITIPNSVTNIGNCAFNGCQELASITIPDSVTNIGSRVFNECSALNNISVGKHNVKYAATSNCLIEKDSKTLLYGCKNSVIPVDASVTSIGDYAFYGCESLSRVTIPDSITGIGRAAFSGCKGLTSIMIPDSVTNIGSRAFDECSGLVSIFVGNRNVNYTAIGNCLIEKNSKTLLCGCKNSVIPIDSSVTSIGDYAFHGCESLSRVTIPDSITSIGDYAFSGCESLSRVTIPDSITSIGEAAFSGCKGLTSITIPGSVSHINSFAFNMCSGLTSVTISDGTTSIGEAAFQSCSALTKITIPNGVTNIDDYSFNWCENLTRITIPGSVLKIGQNAFSSCKKLVIYCEVYSKPLGWHKKWNSYSCPVVWNYRPASENLVFISNGDGTCYVNGIGSYKGKDVVIPSMSPMGDRVTSINSYAFYKCYGMTNISIPDSVMSIGDYAFDDCTGLESITIPLSLTSIGYYAFTGCTALRSITIPDSVTTIGEGAFQGCIRLTSITIPDSVTSIGGSAFEGCTGLTSITIPEGVTSIGSYAFSGCTGLTIYCKLSKQPSGWVNSWNPDNCPVVWSYTQQGHFVVVEPTISISIELLDEYPELLDLSFDELFTWIVTHPEHLDEIYFN